ncbi:MAG: SusD/RagB family nutrient-binding outer membrane lipoprotein [Cytophagales bacterium]|nr:SusD/RagB family nutrient-binding outer membrane lipoprotein [Cytophagales bacterium]
MKKNKISNFVKGVALSAGLILATSCNLQDHLVNPSVLTEDQAESNFIFNGIQLNLAGFFLQASQFGMDNTRMLAMFGNTYENAYTANSFNGMWASAYSDIMVNANLLLSKTKENPATTVIEYRPYFQGATKIMKAYVLMTMVDYFGSIPYSKAFDVSNYNPTVDTGTDVYAAVLIMLNDAIADLNLVVATSVKPANDMYYGGDAAKWRKLANTLKMKMFLQKRLVDAAGSTSAIDALITANDMINSTAEEFFFTATANSVSAPNTYHPWFFQNYQTSASQYMSNSYMKALYDGKGGIRDPRIRFYFYRQVTSPTTDINELSCSSATSGPAHYPPGTAYCQLPDGYWGRDHLNFEGIPPDGLKRTVYGLYPAGGRFDASDNRGVDAVDYRGGAGLSAGAGGKGIIPIMMLSYVNFMRAEHELILKASVANARALLSTAIDQSLSRVTGFNTTVLPQTGAAANLVPSATTKTNFRNAVLVDYDAASTNSDRLNVIINEYWIAAWGNGIEAYNTLRRTGKPTPLQPALSPTPGSFYRSFTYPAVYVIRNSTAVQKPDNKVKVFWDTNPDGFIN